MVFQEGEEITYEDGLCCAKCKKIEPTCSHKTVTRNITVNDCWAEEVSVDVCSGTCGVSIEEPVISVDQNSMLTVSYQRTDQMYVQINTRFFCILISICPTGTYRIALGTNFYFLGRLFTFGTLVHMSKLFSSSSSL